MQSSWLPPLLALGVTIAMGAATFIAVVVREIIGALSAPVILDNQDCRVGASIGISFYPRDGENSETLLTKADGAMYCAKDKGKNTFCFAQG